MNDIIEKCKTTRLLAGIGIAGLILGTIMPYLKFDIFGYKYSVSLWECWEGKIVMLLAIANLLFIFKDIVEKYIPAVFDTVIGGKIKNLETPKYSLIPTILTTIFAIYETVELGAESFEYYNIGFYCLWIGVVCLVAYAILHKNNINNSDSTNQIH